VCVFIYMQNNYTQCTHIYYVNTNFYFGCIVKMLILDVHLITTVFDTFLDNKDFHLCI